MIIRKIYAFLIAIVVLLVCAPASIVVASNEKVSFDFHIDSSSHITVTWMIRGASDLYSYDMNFSFDATRLKLKEASAAHNGFLVPPIVKDNQLRIAHTLVGPKPGMKGDFELITLQFERIAPGRAEVVLDAIKLVDASIDSVLYEPSLAAYTPAAAMPPRDIAGHWAESSIQEALSRGLILGYGDGTFRPQREVTRGEFAVMLARALKLPLSNERVPEFSDLERIPQWSLASVAAAAHAGLIRGYEDHSFRANERITRAEMTTMLVRALPLSSLPVSSHVFADHDLIPEWASNEVGSAFEQGIIKGRNGNRFAPNEHATRAEATVVILGLIDVGTGD